jgi:hypothetical protein
MLGGASQRKELSMHLRIHRPAVLGAAAAAALALSLGPATAADAGVTGPVTYTTTTAGYQVRGTQAFNDLRATVTFPFIFDALSQVNLLLQGTAGAGPTAELSFVYNGGNSNEWTLNWGYSATSATPALHVVTPRQEVTNSPFYLEIHYSTKTHEVAFLGGDESDPTVMARVTGVTGRFAAPAVEVVDSDPAQGLQASFTRVGVTELLRPASLASPTRRLSLAAESLRQLTATQSGKPPAPGNKAVLVPSKLGSGSGFTVRVPA